MRTTCLFAFTIASVVLHVSAQNCLTSNDNQDPNKAGKKTLYNGQQEFSLNLLQAINSLMPESNIFFSPYSTYHALLMAYFISSNTTEMYLRKVLKLDPKQNKADILAAYKVDKLLSSMQRGSEAYEFSNANRIYVDKEVPIRECIGPLFVDELQTQDFKNAPNEARRNINAWVEERTQNMIKDILPPGSLDQTTNLVLANAAFFKGIWENKFDPELTKLEVFHISPSNRTFVDMMHVEGSFNFDISEKLGAHILELPYKGGDISMYILLPPFVKEGKEEGVANILRRLTLDQFKAIVDEQSSLLPRTVNVALPKFSLEHTIELVPILESMGVGNLFRADSDFSQLTGRKDLKLGGGIHKARLEVDERGTRAAAATAVFSFRMMNDEPVEFFHADHPFVFVLYDKRLHTILFMGAYRHPPNT